MRGEDLILSASSPVTMRAATRREEEAGNRTRPVTMRAATRREEEAGNRTRPVTMRAAQRREEERHVGWSAGATLA
jgi:hypothetical protein